jgi:hypothetical protein
MKFHLNSIHFWKNVVLVASFLFATQTAFAKKEIYNEEVIDRLERQLGAINFHDVSDNAQLNLIHYNRISFLKLRMAILPFHQYMVSTANNIVTETDTNNEVSAMAFDILDRGLFGYQAILRKLITVENAYSEVQNPSEEIRTQIAISKALTTLMGADLHQGLFHYSATRRMLKDLLDKWRPKQEAYTRRNEELDALFVRALSYEFRHDLYNEIQTLSVKPQDMAPFKQNLLMRSLETERSYSQFSISDALASGASETTYTLSKLFGTVAGNIKFRKGHFYKREDITHYLAAKLQPFDLMFDKAPFALTDRFIPGHYTHAALYLGTKEQLQELDLWDHPSIIPFHEQIEDGLVIAEALRPGTKLSRLVEFQNVDEIAVYRVKNILDDHKKLENILANAISQIGKAYDFNFDVATKSVIVCSELVYHSIPYIKWPTEYKVGRETITPDHLAELSYFKNSPIDFVFNIYAEGENEIRYRSLNDLAPLMGYKANGKKFEKQFEVCQNVKKPRIRVGSRRDNQLVMRQCHDKFVEQVYRQ